MPPALDLLLNCDDVKLHEAFDFRSGQLPAQYLVFNVSRDVRPFNSILSVVQFEESLEHVNGILVRQSQFQFIGGPMHVFHFPDQGHFVSPIILKDTPSLELILKNGTQTTHHVFDDVVVHSLMIASSPRFAVVEEFASSTLHSWTGHEVFPVQTLNVILHQPEQPISLIFQHRFG